MSEKYVSKNSELSEKCIDQSAGMYEQKRTPVLRVIGSERNESRITSTGRARSTGGAETPTDSGDRLCQEVDGCPTEKAVLQRFWRAHGGVWPAEVVDMRRSDAVTSDLLEALIALRDSEFGHDAENILAARVKADAAIFKAAAE